MSISHSLARWEPLGGGRCACKVGVDGEYEHTASLAFAFEAEYIEGCTKRGDGWSVRGKKIYPRRKKVPPLKGRQNDDYKLTCSHSVPKLGSRHTCEGENPQFTSKASLLRMNGSPVHVRTRQKQSSVGSVCIPSPTHRAYPGVLPFHRVRPR